MKLNRNDLCACGSGKKYKKCCMREAMVSDFGRAHLRNLEESIVDDHLMPYVFEKISKGVMREEFEAFLPFDYPDVESVQLMFEHFFMPWFLFHWEEGRVAREYLRFYRQKLNKHESGFIEAMLKSYYSFYQVLEVEREKSIFLEDLFLGTTHRIKEKQATRTLKRGHIVFSRILTLGADSIFIGMAPWVINPIKYDAIADFKEFLKLRIKKITPEFLARGHNEIISYFFMLLEDIFYPELPKLHNTDGDPIVMTKVYFKTTLAPEEVLKVLMPMTLHEEVEDAEKKKDKNRNTITLEFPWLKRGNKMHTHWKTTILGHFIVAPGKVTLEVNSQNRAETGRKLIERSGKGKIMFERMVMESEKSLMEKAQKTPPKEVEITPKIEEQIKEIMKSHWDNWFDQPIPMLGFETPREAIKKKEGREKLEALFLHYEEMNSKDTKNVIKMDVEYLRKGLGMKKR